MTGQLSSGFVAAGWLRGPLRLLRRGNLQLDDLSAAKQFCPDPAADPITMPFLLTGDPGRERRFDIEIAVHLPADAKLLLEIDQAAVGVLPTVWQERITSKGKNKAILEIPRLRSNAFCDVRIAAAAAHKCQFILKPSKGLATGIHTIAVRQFEQGMQVGGVKWALCPKRKVKR